MSTFLSGLDFFVNQVRALPPEILVTVKNHQQLTEVEKQRHREFSTIAWTHQPLSPFHLFGALADLSVKNDEYREALAYLHTIDGSFLPVRDDQKSFEILMHVIETKESLLKHEQMLMVDQKIHRIPSVYDLHTFLEHASTMFQMEQYMGRRLFPQDAREISQVADALAEATACGTEQALQREMQVKEADHDQILGDFLQSIADNKGMIANEKSMPILMEALKNSTLGSKATVSIAAALLKNATKYSEPTGRHVRGFFSLTQDDEDIDLFVLQAIHGAQGRILNKDVVLDIHNLSAKASFTKEKLDVIGLALRANAEQFPLCKTECTAPDDIEVWAPKMRDFLKRIGFVDCTLAVEAIEVLHNRIQKPVPLRMIGSLINSLLVETFSVDQKVPLAERIMKLALVCVQPEEVDPIRSHVVCGFFALVDRATPNLVDFLTTEIYKTTKLALPKEAVGHMHHVVFESNLSGDQKKQLTDAIESRTTKPKTTRIQNIKALLFSSNLEDKAVSDFILSEVTKCMEPILTPPDFERFVRKLDSEKVQSATKIEFITKLMENADL